MILACGAKAASAAPASRRRIIQLRAAQVTTAIALSSHHQHLARGQQRRRVKQRAVPRLPVTVQPGLVLTLSVLSLPLWPTRFAPGVAARLSRTAETSISITEIVLRSAVAPWEVFCRFFIRGFSLVSSEAVNLDLTSQFDRMAF